MPVVAAAFLEGVVVLLGVKYMFELSATLLASFQSAFLGLLFFGYLFQATYNYGLLFYNGIHYIDVFHADLVLRNAACYLSVSSLDQYVAAVSSWGLFW